MGKRRVVTPGERYGRWSIVEEAEPSKGHRRFLCRCDCGNTAVVPLGCLVAGSSKSCGCYENDVKTALKTKHGGTYTRLYDIWRDMKRRCSNPHRKAYKHYGGRGITFCEEWREFARFRSWAEASGYRDDLTLERSNCNGNYEPANCCWIPLSDQNSNRRSSRMITFQGETKSLNRWADQYGIKYTTLCGRLNRGISIAEAIALGTPEGRGR